MKIKPATVGTAISLGIIIVYLCAIDSTELSEDAQSELFESWKEKYGIQWTLD